MKAGLSKVGLAVGAAAAALLLGAVTGGALTATGGEPRVTQVRAADEDASPEGNPAAREFVSAKKAWTACVKKAAPAQDSEGGRLDPEQACGTKPHPHDVTGKHADKHSDQPSPTKHQGHGPPAWAGGPDRRTAEPPGHAKRN